MLKVFVDFDEYKPWSGAESTYNTIAEADKLEELEDYLEELYPDGVSETTINDLLWFDGEQVLKDLGIVELPTEVEYNVNTLYIDLEDEDTSDDDIREAISDQLYDDYDEEPSSFNWQANEDNSAVIVTAIEW